MKLMDQLIQYNLPLKPESLAIIINALQQTQCWMNLYYNIFSATIYNVLKMLLNKHIECFQLASMEWKQVVLNIYFQT